MYNYTDVNKYFTASKTSYTDENTLSTISRNLVKYTNSSFDISDGYALTLKAEVKGKILIPSMFNGKPVIRLGLHTASE